MDGVPTVLEIAIPELQDVEQHVMNVLSSSNRAAKLAFELSIDNIEYLSRAVHAEAPAATHQRQRASRRKPFSALTPNVFLSRGGNMMLCRYKDGNGKTKMHSRMVPRLDDAELLDKVKDNIAGEIQQFFPDHNHEEKESDGNDISEDEGGRASRRLRHDARSRWDAFWGASVLAMGRVLGASVLAHGVVNALRR